MLRILLQYGLSVICTEADIVLAVISNTWVELLLDVVEISIEIIISQLIM